MEALARFYKLDKEATSGFHDYIPIYNQLLEHKRFDMKTILEIGIGCVEKGQMTHVSPNGYKTGNSARMWRDYCPNANIYALHINPEAMFSEPRITTFTADQSNREQLEQICKSINQPLDFVIDDGSHQYEHQIASFIYLEPFLASNAIYCIEDVHENNLAKIATLQDFPRELQQKLQNEYNLLYFDRRRKYPFWPDDNIICFQKKN